MPAARFDLIIEQGADYEATIPVLDEAGQPQTLTGWTAAGQIRAGYASTTALATLDLTAGATDIILRVPAATSAAWGFRLARYDVEVVAPGGATTRLVEGAVVVRPEITRAP